MWGKTVRPVLIRYPKSDTKTVRNPSIDGELFHFDITLQMSYISESKFAEICEGINADRAVIVKHNPIGTEQEILLWMLLSCLVTYLSLEDNQTPCFTGRPDAETYRDAIGFVLNGRSEPIFDPQPHIERMLAI